MFGVSLSCVVEGGEPGSVISRLDVYFRMYMSLHLVCVLHVCLCPLQMSLLLLPLAASLLALLPPALSLSNNVGQLPEMGFNTWCVPVYSYSVPPPL